MLARVHSAAIAGLDAYKVEIEVNATGFGRESYVNVVGLPDAAVRESRDRVQSAIEASGLSYPYGKTIVNLAPADVRKEGASFDLPIALGMMAANRVIDPGRLVRGLFLGELALDGSVRPVKGALPMGLMAEQAGDVEFMLLPADNAAEAAIAARSVRVLPVRHLREAYEHLKGFGEGIKPFARPSRAALDDASEPPARAPDMADVKGQLFARRGLEIAAAGGHNVLLIGPPGAGKSMLARRLPGILPPMSVREALEATKIHSVMGALPPGSPLLARRPFRAPHHTNRDAGLIGGGMGTPAPGEISLAHNGVLFMDEMPEFRRNVLEVLRQPLETGMVCVARSGGSFHFPADFMLVAAMNPCPCGYYGSTQRECRCSHQRVMGYRGKLSGPLLDRIDIHVEVAALGEEELLSAPASESSAAIRSRVVAARKRQVERLEGFGASCNARMDSAAVQAHCALDRESKSCLRHAIAEMRLSARAYDRILKVARTIADLEGAQRICERHISEAAQFRNLDKRYW